MLRLALRGAVARRVRLALTAAAVVIGVAFVSGTLVLSDTLDATFDSVFGTAGRGVSVVVRGTSALPPGGLAARRGAPGEERSLVPDAVLQQVRTVPGVAAAVGTASGYAQLVAHGRAVSNGGAPTLGVTWTGDAPSNPLRLRSGRAPAAPGEVVVDERSARTARVAAGDAASAVVTGQVLPVRVVGVVSYGDSATLGGATVTAFVPAQAQQLLLGRAGAWSSVEATAAPGVTQDALAARVRAALGPSGRGVEVLTERAYAAAQSAQVKDRLKFFDAFLLVFAFVAVFVAVFIIANTFTVLVAQRTRELALLRALGASRRQVVGSVVAEAAAVGVICGAAGLVLGLGVAQVLRAVISGFSGGGLTTVGLQLRWPTVLAALLVGTVATVGASVVPAWRSGRVPPVAAMREDVVAPTRSLRRRTRLAAAVVAVGAAVLGSGIASSSAGRIGIGALLVFRGVVWLSPVLSRPVIRVLGAPLPRWFGVAGRLARENALRSPRRTAATASALMVGVALTSTMSVMAASVTASANAAIDAGVGADFIVTAGREGPVPAAVAPALRRVPGAGAVTELRAGAAQVAGAGVLLEGVTADTVGATLRLHTDAGSLDALAHGQLLVNRSTADKGHLHVGSGVPARFAVAGPRTLVVGGVYADNPIAGPYLLGMDTYDQLFRNRLAAVVAVRAAPGADLGRLRAGLASALASTPGLRLQDQTQFKADQRRQVGRLLAFVLALLVLSLLVAWLGIVNTLALSVYERTRELGLLRAVGMGVRQVRRMVRLEAVVIAAFGALLGVLLGLGYGAALVRALHGVGITQTRVPVAQLVTYLVVGVLAGVTAAWWPARRACRLDVLAAISAE